MISNCITMPSADELRLASKHVSETVVVTDLHIPEIKCGACVAKLEKQLGLLPSVHQVRANLTKQRIRLQWDPSRDPETILNAISKLGFSASLLDSINDGKSDEVKSNFRALAVSGFAASNIMLLSIAVWSGAEESTRQWFHWISAVIALPAVAYSGRVFFASAWRAIRAGRTNMDVPISVGIILSVLLGVYDTINHYERVYFEAATMLVFFLLIGRTLDKLMRVRATASADALRDLEPKGATVLHESGELRYTATNQLRPKQVIVVKAGDRIPVDGVIASGDSNIDTAIVDGESLPKKVQPGCSVLAGTLNVSEALHITVTADAKNSFLAQMHKLVQIAQHSKGIYTQMADRAARWYAPLVHSAALIAFIGWIYATGDVHRSITIAISVLIITCPCALALAVPMVHVMAGSQLLRRGLIMKEGAALEKLSAIGAVVFDKTGTLTTGPTVLNNPGSYTRDQLSMILILTQQSEHPYAKALLASAEKVTDSKHNPDGMVVDVPGLGLEACVEGKTIRLGRREWAAYLDYPTVCEDEKHESETVLACNGRLECEFFFTDQLRPDAEHAIERLFNHGLDIAIVSGDRPEPVNRVANKLSIHDVHAQSMPAQKMAVIQEKAKYKPVLMVGDGINDCGAMAAAHVAMAPGTASSIGRNTADFVFLNESLAAVPDALDIANKARKLVKQNMVIAVIYNMVVLPVAFAGMVTPLIAALSMSLSSIAVVANAMRLNTRTRKTVSNDATKPALKRYLTDTL